MLSLLSEQFAVNVNNSYFYYYFTISLETSRLPCDQLQKAEASEVDEVDEEPAVVQSAQLFAPKSLVLVSRLDYTDVFRVRTR